MGSVGFGLEDESQPNGNLPGKLLAGCGSVCHVTVPRKQRSSIEKRAKHRVELQGKDRPKKLKLDLKQGQVTKDEEEVAEALYALANMFTGANKVKKPVQFDGASETRSALQSEEGDSIAYEEKKPKIISSKVILETTQHSSDLATSTAQVVSVQATSPGTETPSSEMSEDLRLSSWFTTTNYGNRSHPVGNDTSSVKHTPVEQKKSLKRCCTHVYISCLIKTLKLTEKNDDLLEHPTQLTTSREPQSRFNTLDQTTEINGIHGGVPFSGIIAHSAAEKDSVENKKDIFLHNRSLRDQQPVSENSPGQRGYNFLSLSSGACDLDTVEVVDRARRSHEDPKVSHFHYMQPQNESSQIFSAPKGYSSTFHGNSSALAAQQVKREVITPPQVQLPHYMSSTIDSIFSPWIPKDQTESQQHPWATHLQAQYSNIWGVGATMQLPEWPNGARNSSMLNYAQALFPHLHAALTCKYQQTPPRSLQQSLAIDWPLPHSDAKRDLHPPRFPSGFERNGVGFYPENAPQLWPHCNQHL